MFGDLAAPALFLIAAIALSLLGAIPLLAGSYRRSTAIGPEPTESAAGRAYLDRLFGPAPASAGVSREGSQNP